MTNIKKSVFLLLITMLLFSCLGKKSVKENQDVITITGKITNGENNKLCLMENWQSRSRVAYYLEGEGLDELQFDQIVTVKGIVLKRHHQFKADFKVLKIVEIKE